MGLPTNSGWLEQAVRNGLVTADQVAGLPVEKLVPTKSRASESAEPDVQQWAVEFEIDWRPTNESNLGGGLPAKLARKKAAKVACQVAIPPHLPPPPVRVTLTRTGGIKRMDRDGMVTSLKWVQDAIAAALGVDDGDRDKVRWRYRQRPSYGKTRVHVRVESC
jgi:hypothetical protein